MERQIESNANLPAFAQDLVERGKREGLREGSREGRLAGKLEGFREGRLHGKREVLLRLMVRGGAVGEAERARIVQCTDATTLDRWIDNAVSVPAGGDVFD